MLVPFQNNLQLVKKYMFRREIPRGLKIGPEIDDKVKADTVLASGEKAEERARIDISSILKINPEDAIKHLNCINGERVKKGEIIVLKKKKVMHKEQKIQSPYSGVVDLSEIKSGILRILGVAKEQTISAGIGGKVVSIIKDRQLGIECEVLKFKVVSLWGETVQGEMFYLDEKCDKVETGKNLNGDILILGMKPKMEFLRKLAIAGVSGVILPSISTKLIKELELEKLGLWGMTLCITEGFGTGLSFSKFFISLARKNDGYIGLIDSKNDEIIFTNLKDIPESVKNPVLVDEVEIGDPVQILDEGAWGKWGKVIEVSDKVVRVEVEGSREIETSIHNLVLTI
ncbi:hypothetical protein JW766_05440 [Candidatus Dojkabacteria bacterium]|nr:hypothetical protein [Candidatus Dojkabacteria bacterium]